MRVTRSSCRDELVAVPSRAAKKSAVFACLLLVPLVPWAASFTIERGQTLQLQQTLNAAESGLIKAGGTLDTGADSAVLMPGANAVMQNSGMITTSGAVAIGISSSGDDASITNTGEISTSIFAASGIQTTGLRASITNRGLITTSGIGAAGIESFGDFADISSSGQILTSGFSGTGIISYGANARITNSGQIQSSGINGLGITSGGASATIINRGRIVMSGPFAAGILLNGGGAATTISNSGLISATGQESFAIQGDAGDTTLTLLPGSRILGSIDLGGGTDIVNISGASSYSATLTFDNTEQINLLGAPGVVMGNTVAVVDPTGYSIQSALISTITGSIHDAVRQRTARAAAAQPVHVAAQKLAPGMYYEHSPAVAWAEAFGGRRDRGNDGANSSYEHDYFGMMGGYERNFDQRRIGFFGGAVRSDATTQGNTYSSESDAVFIGSYALWNFGKIHFSASVIGGAADHDSERLVIDNLNGSERAESDFNSYFLSPSVSLVIPYAIRERLELRPAVTLTYSIARQEDYRESGTSQSNLQLDDRTLHAFDTRLQLAAVYRFEQAAELEVRGGVSNRYTDSDDVHLSLAGTDLHFSAKGEKNVTGGFVGGNLRMHLNQHLNLVADAEYARAEADEREWQASAKLEYSF